MIWCYLTAFVLGLAVAAFTARILWQRLRTFAFLQREGLVLWSDRGHDWRPPLFERNDLALEPLLGDIRRLKQTRVADLGPLRVLFFTVESRVLPHFALYLFGIDAFFITRGDNFYDVDMPLTLFLQGGSPRRRMNLATSEQVRLGMEHFGNAVDVPPELSQQIAAAYSTRPQVGVHDVPADLLELIASGGAVGFGRVHVGPRCLLIFIRLPHQMIEQQWPVVQALLARLQRQETYLGQ